MMWMSPWRRQLDDARFDAAYQRNRADWLALALGDLRDRIDEIIAADETGRRCRENMETG